MKTETTNQPNNTTATSVNPTAAPTALTPPTEQTIVDAAARVATSLNYKDCYTKWKPRWMLIPADDAMRVTVDVGYVIQSLYGILPEVEKHRAELYRECSTLSPTLIEDVREATGGLGHCEMLKRGGAEVVNDSVDNPVQVVRGIRGQLTFHGGPLIAKGLLTTADLTASQGNSPRDIAFDVMKFVAKIGDNYEHLKGKSMLTRAELDAATKAAEDLLEFLGIKEKTVATAEETTLMRQRALTQVYELYEELRAGMRFARRKQKDFNTITPSIFTMRTKKTSRDSEDEAPTAADDATGADSASTDQDNAASAGIDLTQLQALMSSGGASGNGASSNGASTNASASPLPNGSSGNTTASSNGGPVR